MKILKSFMTFACLLGALLVTYSCTDWGQSDPPAGNQVYPSREAKGPYTFKGLAGIDEAEFIVSTTGSCAVAYDDSLYTEVLELEQGTAVMQNPLKDVKLQIGAGVAMWVKTDGENAADRIFSFVSEDGSSSVNFTVGGLLESPTKPSAVELAGRPLLTADTWHFLAVQMNNTSSTVYLDGEVVATTEYEKDDDMVTVINEAPYFVIGGQQNGALAVDRISLVRNNMNASDVKRPTVTKVVSLPEPVYFCDFSSTEGLTIVGGGSFRDDATAGFGRVFQNKASTAPRQNYLLLPEHVLSHSAETEQMTIGFWVNAENAGTSASYNWAPIFTAYGAAPAADGNTWPMMACQYRGVLQLNNNGWSDYTNEQNVDGANHLYHNDTDADWLADHKWHYYTVVFDGENAKVYFDGEVKNEWQMDGAANTQRGLYTNGGDLKYVCLGGNQAWSWADNDPGFAFDDVAIYDQALNAEQIQKIISTKGGGGGTVLPVDLPEAYYRNTFESADDRGLQIIGEGEFINKSGDKHGMVFRNAASTAPRQNYLLLPDDLLSHSADSKQLSISFWVNASQCGESDTYLWAPLFMAYSAAPTADGNTWPMMACQYRGVLQVNCDGWTDFTDAQNTAGVNTLYHGELDWLADKEWHYYTVVLDNENAKVYFDGELKNEWNNDGATNTLQGLYASGSKLSYICLGGNQAWSWGDNDAPFEFDDIMFFDTALTASQIKALMSVYNN